MGVVLERVLPVADLGEALELVSLGRGGADRDVPGSGGRGRALEQRQELEYIERLA